MSDKKLLAIHEALYGYLLLIIKKRDIDKLNDLLEVERELTLRENL
jgi:diadenosine tetraphosphate (Ap4A) HIT family hydrolase